MEREILFKGKRADNKEWVEGYFVKDPKNQYRIYWQPFPEASSNTYHFIIPETLGQFVWLTDKDGVKAFVGDIYIDAKGVKRTIIQDNGGFVTESNPMAFGYGTNPYEPLSDEQSASWFSGTCKIIGNIHDNSNLIQ